MRYLRSIFSRRTMVYLTYALLLTGMLLYIRFPADKFKQFCENRLELILTETLCTIERITYQFPLTFTFYGVNLSRIGDSVRDGYFIDGLSLTLDPTNLPKNITLVATLYGGTLSARLAGDFVGRKIELHDIKMNGLRVGALQKSLAIPERKIEGTLGFTGSYQAKFDNPAGGTGQGRVVADTGSVALFQPVLSLQQISFNQVVCNLRYDNRKFEVFAGTLHGKDVTADFAGEFRLASSVASSELQLSGRLVPQPAFIEAHPQEQKIVQAVMKRYNMAALPFRVGGTLNSPTFRFSM